MFYRVSRSYCFNIQPIIPRKSFRDGYTIHAIQPCMQHGAQYCSVNLGPQFSFELFKRQQRRQNMQNTRIIASNIARNYFRDAWIHNVIQPLRATCAQYIAPCIRALIIFFIESFERNQNRPNMQNTRSIDRNIAQNDFRDGYKMQSSHCLQHFLQYCTVYPSLLGYWNATKEDQTCQVRAGTYCFNLLLNSNHCTFNQFQKYFYFCTAS